MSNLQKYLAGLDPTNPASILRLQIAAKVSAQGTSLSWPTVPGKNYRVQCKNSLNDPAWSDIAGASIVGFQGSLGLPVDQPGRFYRVVAQ